MYSSTLQSIGHAGFLLLLAYIVAVPLGLAGKEVAWVLYLSIALILLAALHSRRVSSILKGLLERVGGLAFLFWLLLAIFKLAVVPLTSVQLFWTFIAALVIRAAVEI